MLSFKNVSVIWGGRVITGFSDDGDLTIAPSNDAVSAKTGLQGDVCYCLSADESGTVKFALFPTSAALAGLRADARSGARKSLMIRDTSDDAGFILQAENCVVTRVPDMIRGKESKAVDVTIFVPSLGYMA